jgi:glucose-6-phosphate isomerase
MKTWPINDNPVSIEIDLTTGIFSPCLEYEPRCLSKLANMFHDRDAVDQSLETGDPLIYEIRYYPFITRNSDMVLGTSRIHPGKIGDEYYMTKGHFHETDNQPEIYHCVQGSGYLIMMNQEGEFHSIPWKAGTITHIPPQYAHRVINTGSTPLVFVSSFHVAAGHDYGMIEEKGFKYLILERDGAPAEVLNPKWDEKTSSFSFRSLKDTTNP